MRLAFVVSHPIQYYVPLYRRLAACSDIEIKVFFTWHGGTAEVFDQGFKQPVAWDIPLTDGYESEVVENISRAPGTHHFLGLQNPELIKRVKSWKPNAVHLTGYSFASHLALMRAMAADKIPLLFRGDSHLLDETAGWKSTLKRIVLKKIFSWPSAFLYVGQNNKEYYQSFGVPDEKLFYCPHSIEVDRFAEPAFELEQAAAKWRSELNLPEDAVVGLFAGKFEDVKRPQDLMNWFLADSDEKSILIMAGGGKHETSVREMAAKYHGKFRVLPFQNQKTMPILYRLSDYMILPSVSETWGLAVNEAMACGRPVLVSDRVGCAPEMVVPGVTGEIFSVDRGARPSRVPRGASSRNDSQSDAQPFTDSPSPNSLSASLHPPQSCYGGRENFRVSDFPTALNKITSYIRSGTYSREVILNHAQKFGIPETEKALSACLKMVAR